MRKPTRFFGIVVALGSALFGNIARAQAQPRYMGTSSANASSNSIGPGAAAVSPSDEEPSSNAIESSLFYSLFMAGKTKDQFQPLNARKRLKVYSKDLLSPFHLAMAGATAGIAQLQNVPPEWGQGSLGYARRYANYYAYATTSSLLQMAGEDLLHEDNLYFGSGEHGVWRRMKYAVKSSVLARSADGSRHISASQLGSTAAAAYISRLWQPASNDSAGDFGRSFAISLATNAGVNVIREFLPDVTRHIFRRIAPPAAQPSTTSP